MSKEDSRGPTVFLSPTARRQLDIWVDEAGNQEFSCLGEVEIVKGDLHVSRFHLARQTNNQAHTDMDEASVNEILRKVCMEGRKAESLRCWAHSHGNIEVMWSGEDDATIKRQVAMNGEWTLSIVVNRHKGMRARFDALTPVPFTLDRLDVRNAGDPQEDERLRQELREATKKPDLPPSTGSSAEKGPTAQIMTTAPSTAGGNPVEPYCEYSLIDAAAVIEFVDDLTRTTGLKDKVDALATLSDMPLDKRAQHLANGLCYARDLIWNETNKDDRTARLLYSFEKDLEEEQEAGGSAEDYEHLVGPLALLSASNLMEEVFAAVNGLGKFQPFVVPSRRADAPITPEVIRGEQPVPAPTGAH